MKIISRFNDYYDHVAHLFGGGDPKIVYSRYHLTPTGNLDVHDKFNPIKIGRKTELIDPVWFSRRGRQPNLPSTHESYAWSMYDMVWLCLMGKTYLCLSTHPDYTPTFYEKVPGAGEYVHKLLNYNRRWWAAHIPTLDQLIGGMVYPELVSICQELQAPIFTFAFGRPKDGVMTFCVDRAIPILSTVGISSIVSTTQIYQDLSYFMANTINGSPDVDPPVVLTDKERIVQHGFDLVTSFRGSHNGKK